MERSILHHFPHLYWMWIRKGLMSVSLDPHLSVMSWLWGLWPMCGVKVVWAWTWSSPGQASERQAAWPAWRGLIKTLLSTDTACSPAWTAECVALSSTRASVAKYSHMSRVWTLQLAASLGWLSLARLPADWFMRYCCHYWRNLFGCICYTRN